MHFHESITLRKEILFLHPTSYNQSLPFVLLSITHHVLTPSVSSRSLPLGLTRTSPSPSRLGAHPCILFLPLSPFIHLSIFQLLYIERSPLLLLWCWFSFKSCDFCIPNFVHLLCIYSLKLVFNSHLELAECSFWTLFVHLRVVKF